MASVRKVYKFNRIDANFVTYPADATIVPPALTPNGFVPGLSAQVGLACTNVGTGLGGPIAGLGAAGTYLFGQIRVVEQDGAVGVQHRGYMHLPYVTGANQPVIGQPVSVDGTGNVQKAATFSGAICEGFELDPEPIQPTAVSVLKCIVRKY